MPIPLRGNNDIIVANHNIPVISESKIENLASSSAESIIIQPPSVAKKKKKNKNRNKKEKVVAVLGYNHGEGKIISNTTPIISEKSNLGLLIPENHIKAEDSP